MASWLPSMIWAAWDSTPSMGFAAGADMLKVRRCWTIRRWAARGRLGVVGEEEDDGRARGAATVLARVRGRCCRRERSI